METLDILIGAVIGAIIVVASVLGAGYTITKRK